VSVVIPGVVDREQPAALQAVLAQNAA
jgi:hypothetical protein